MNAKDDAGKTTLAHVIGATPTNWLNVSSLLQEGATVDDTDAQQVSLLEVGHHDSPSKLYKLLVGAIGARFMQSCKLMSFSDGSKAKQVFQDANTGCLIFDYFPKEKKHPLSYKVLQ